MLACDVQLYMFVQYSRWEWKKLVYRDFIALGVSVCLTLLRKKMERESLFVRAEVCALNERFSSKCMPSSLKDLEVGFS